MQGKAKLRGDVSRALCGGARFKIDLKRLKIFLEWIEQQRRKVFAELPSSTQEAENRANHHGAGKNPVENRS